MEKATEKPRKQPLRSELALEYKWHLEDMFSSDADWEAEFARVKELLNQVTQFKGELHIGPKNLLSALSLRDEVEEAIEKVFVYARMRKDEDNTNPEYQALSDRSQSLITQVSSAFAFMSPEILAIPEETLREFTASEPGLTLYRHALEDLLRQKPHVLSQAEEELLAQASDLSRAPSDIFDMFNDADIRFPTIVDENGEEVEVTKGRYRQLIESKDRRVRRAAFEALYSSYLKQNNTLAAILNASVKKDCFFARVRKYDSALHSALDDDNMPLAVYDNLISTVRQYLPLMHRYVTLRRRLLQLDELHMYDLYTPLVPEVDYKAPYEEAKKIVLKALSPLGSEYTTPLQAGLNNGWVDVYENKGKTSGAYSWGAYGSHPYVLLNYQGTLDDVFTLAHELGHSMHTYFSNQSQPYVYAGYTIFVAEVASTVNENLLIRHLLQNTKDKTTRLYLLNHQLEGFRTTIFRQTMFAEFEKRTHALVEKGDALTVDYLCEAYRALNQDYYGKDLVLDSEINMEWARIPHFYRAFYVYKYATGFSAATSLSMQILQEGKPAVERYLEFLSAGSSDYPLSLLQKAGVDMSKPQPVENAMTMFSQLLDEMETLGNQA